MATALHVWYVFGVAGALLALLSPGLDFSLVHERTAYASARSSCLQGTLGAVSSWAFSMDRANMS